MNYQKKQSPFRQGLVSVIVPNYNYERFLSQRIDSILCQTYKDIEVIILDDCSTDNSVDVINRYASNPYIKHICINQRNSGSTFIQWKKGFNCANGEYIWIAEADDYADPLFLETILLHMEADKSIKVGFSNSYWETDTNSFINKDYSIPEKYKKYRGIPFIKSHLLKENFIYNASMAVFRHDALYKVDPIYATFKSCGDKLFWASLAEQGSVVFVSQPLNHFRIHLEKVTSKSIINGTLFKEELRFFHMNIKKGYVSIFKRISVVKYFLSYIKRYEDKFLTDEIYQDCLNLWMNEVNPRNPHLPLAYKFICRFIKIKA